MYDKGQENTSLWFCEKELENWFRDHPNRRSTQSLKRSLISKYWADNEVFLLPSVAETNIVDPVNDIKL